MPPRIAKVPTTQATVETSKGKAGKAATPRPVESGVRDHIKYHTKHKKVLATKKAQEKALAEAERTAKEKADKDARLKTAVAHYNDKAAKANSDKKPLKPADDFGPASSSSDPFQPLPESE